MAQSMGLLKKSLLLVDVLCKAGKVVVLPSKGEEYVQTSLFWIAR